MGFELMTELLKMPIEALIDTLFLLQIDQFPIMSALFDLVPCQIVSYRSHFHYYVSDFEGHRHTSISPSSSYLSKHLHPPAAPLLPPRRRRHSGRTLDSSLVFDCMEDILCPTMQSTPWLWINTPPVETLTTVRTLDDLVPDESVVLVSLRNFCLLRSIRSIGRTRITEYHECVPEPLSAWIRYRFIVVKLYHPIRPIWLRLHHLGDDTCRETSREWPPQVAPDIVRNSH